MQQRILLPKYLSIVQHQFYQCEASIDALLGTVHKHRGGGGLMQISIIVKKFGASLFRAYFWPGQPHRKACKLDFYWKFLIFFQGLLYKGQTFCISPPPSICEHFLTNLDHFKLIFFMIKHYLSVISVSTVLDNISKENHPVIKHLWQSEKSHAKILW